jgi:hypothetical protein
MVNEIERIYYQTFCRTPVHSLLMLIASQKMNIEFAEHFRVSKYLKNLIIGEIKMIISKQQQK